ncbi:b497194e-7239-45dc-80ea-1b3f270caca1 [Thermothielavioides terrestris]|jgi:hypothetical protein|uniref:B497194e-7239-45dc-80ea-1b3f270caca1 n=1 Tax=Thermothielavioides terrestris TaxID=2587410 RepID=A0A446BW27_9PEZI|nr:b497194e-7239-45dc-80ea-1b3f270caca1 [Thermothielavioides terrestris]
MASRLFFDPVVLLRTAPLVSSTCTLLYGTDQSFFLGLLNRPAATRARSRPLLPDYFAAFFRRGVVFVVACLAVTTWSSVANLYVRPAALRARDSRWWYVAGAVLSASHLLFVPLVAPSIKATVDADEKGTDANASLDEWLTVNWVRTLTVDLGAWAACFVAAVKSLEA